MVVIFTIEHDAKYRYSHNIEVSNTNFNIFFFGLKESQKNYSLIRDSERTIDWLAEACRIYLTWVSRTIKEITHESIAVGVAKVSV